VSNPVREVLGHYTIVSLLGAGGMGEVYLADDPRLGRRVAIKVLPAGDSRDDEAKRRMLREARAVAALDHPNVCTIYEVGEHEGRPYIVMQYIEGETLFERLQQGQMSLAECVDIGSQVAAALDEAHSRGIVHRDVKPPNIIITPRGLVKVLDFGLAKFSDHSNQPTDLLLSKPGVITGTAPYMSPEQLRSSPVDGRSDIFSLGVVLYEMATGSRPFDRESAVSTITAILFEEPAPIEGEEYAPLAPIVRRALAKEPAKRFPTAAMLRDALQHAVERTRARPKRPRTDELDVTQRMAAPVVPRAKTRIASLAVLPLPTGELRPEHEYLVYGLSEGIVNALSQTRRLRVLASTTVARYVGADVEPRQVGRELNVDAVVGVRARVEGDALSVDVSLIATEGEAPLWTSHFARAVREVAALAETIAREVSDRVRERMSGAVSKRSATTAKKKRAVDPEAQQLFLKGRFQWIKRHPEAIKQAMNFFQKAVEADPMFAPPYAGLADAFLMLGFMQALPAREVLPKCKAAAQRAIELDPALSDPHATLGYAAGLFEWDWETAQRELEEAMRMNENNAWAPHWLGLLSCGRGETRRGLELIEWAMTLDPLSPIVAIAAGIPLHVARCYDAAVMRFQSVLDTEMSFAPGHYYIGLAYEQLRQYDEAIRHFEKLPEIAGPVALYLGALGHCYGVAGRTAQAEGVLEQLHALSKQRYITPYSFLMVYLGLGRHDEALASLEAALEERNAWLWFLPIDPRYDRLREDPRFAPLVERHGLSAFIAVDGC
jgi:TolB-like protein/tetratricopeptide (TPR) repeat protein/predicted Ser/Thr protein kinase